MIEVCGASDGLSEAEGKNTNDEFGYIEGTCDNHGDTVWRVVSGNALDKAKKPKDERAG